MNEQLAMTYYIHLGRIVWAHGKLELEVLPMASLMRLTALNSPPSLVIFGDNEGNSCQLVGLCHFCELSV